MSSVAKAAVSIVSAVSSVPSLRRVTILGSTGSIGENTLDVIARHPERFTVYALVANSRDDILLQQCLAHRPRIAVLNHADAAQRLRDGLKSALGAGSSQIEVLEGEAAAIAVATATEADTVVAAIVGAAGLPATLAAAKAGKRILLANKEALVKLSAQLAPEFHWNEFYRANENYAVGIWSRR